MPPQRNKSTPGEDRKTQISATVSNYAILITIFHSFPWFFDTGKIKSAFSSKKKMCRPSANLGELEFSNPQRQTALDNLVGNRVKQRLLT